MNKKRLKNNRLIRHRHPDIFFNPGRLKFNTFSSRKIVEYLINILKHSGKKITQTQFNNILNTYTDKEKRSLAGKMIKLIENKGSKIPLTLQKYTESETTLERAFVDIFINTQFSDIVFGEMCSHLLMLQEKQSAKTGTSSQETRISEMGQLFDLDETECEILTLLYLYDIDVNIDSIYDEFIETMGFKQGYIDMIRQKSAVAVICGLRLSRVSKALSKNGKLARTGLLDKELNLAEEVILYIENQSSKPITSSYFKEFKQNAIPLDEHIVDKKDINAISALLETTHTDRGINILFYGPPGTGKTEFAHSLGRHFNRKIYEIKNLNRDDSGRDKDDINHFRHRAFAACHKFAKNSGSMIIVDEADSMLNNVPGFFSITPAAEKGQINRLLDESHTFSVWITNRSDGIDESTCRRFDYSVRFEKLTFEQRKNIWKNNIFRYRLGKCFNTKDIEYLAKNYEASAGGIDVALRNVSRIYKKHRRKTGMLEMAETFLKSHLKITKKESLLNNKKSSPDVRNYSIEGLNICPDIKQTLSIIDRFNRAWDKNEQPGILMNMNILLYGEPGTGKTEFAKYIARRLNRSLVKKNASELLNMYVGQTEKIIRESFREAQQDRSVLFIDEADSMLGTRGGAFHSWEVTQTNEILTCMENFSGIFICSTNLKTRLDPASIRRFNIKLEFRELKSGDIVPFYKRFMNDLIKQPLPEREKQRLMSIKNLTPGDFKSVYKNYAFFDRKEISHDMIINALKRETGEKPGNAGIKMGFGK